MGIIANIDMETLLMRSRIIYRKLIDRLKVPLSRETFRKEPT